MIQVNKEHANHIGCVEENAPVTILMRCQCISEILGQTLRDLNELAGESIEEAKVMLGDPSNIINCLDNELISIESQALQCKNLMQNLSKRIQ